MILDELLVALGFQYDPEDMKKFKEDLSKTTGFIRQLTGIAIKGAAALTGLTVASTRASDEQGKLSSEIGETVENIDALTFAQQRAGGSAGDMVSSLRDLAKISAEAARGVGSGVEAFGILGVSSLDAQGKLKPVSDLMLEISSQFRTLSTSQQIDLADKLGVRGSIRLLQQGPDEIKNLISEARALGVTTKEDAAIAADFQDSLTDLWTIIKQITRTISRTLAPVMKENISLFSDWWKINRDLIEAKIPEWINSVTKGFKLLAVAAGAFIAFRLVSHFVTLTAMLKGATLATLGLNAAALLLPALIAAAVVGFAALIEDAKVFFEGGESFIGDMLKKFPEWKDEIITIASIFGTISDLTGMIFDGWSKIFNLFSTSSIDDFKEFLKNIPGFLGDITGISPVDPKEPGLLSSIGSLFSFNEPRTLSAPNTTNTTRTTTVGSVSITVEGSGLNSEAVARDVFNIFQQTSEELNSAVDQ